MEVLKEVTRRLDRARIAYMITGSTAANFYTVPRMTRDIDLVVELTDKDADRVVEIFADDFYIDRQAVEQAVNRKSMFNLIHTEYVIKVDFVVRKDSAYRRMEFSRRRKFAVDEQVLRVVAPEDLILSKLDWAKESRSEVQLTDVRNLLQSVKGLNRRYLARWRNGWASRPYTGRSRDERHLRCLREQIPRDAPGALRRGTAEDGLFHARHGSSVGPRLDIASRSSGVSRRFKEGALSALLRPGLRRCDAQKDSSSSGE